MKTFLLSLCLAVVALAAEPIAELKIGNTIYKRARIVAINGDNVALVHAGGATDVPADMVPLDLLARAHIEIEAEKEARKKSTNEIVKRDAALQVERANEKADRDAATAELAKLRAASAQRPADKRAPQRFVNVEQEILRLKAAFPAKSPGSVRVFIPRSGQNRRPYIVSSTVAQLPGGATYSSTTTTHNAGEGRVDTFQYTAPSDDTWSWYRGIFQTTTAQALPRTLQMVEQRIAEDTAKCQAAAGGSSMSAAAQAQHTLYWFDKMLRPYMAQWRAPR